MIKERYKTDTLHHVAVFLNPKFKYLKMLNQVEQDVVHDYIKELLSTIGDYPAQQSNVLEPIQKKAELMTISLTKAK